MSARFSNDVSKIITASSNQAVKVWSTSSGLEDFTLSEGYTAQIHSICFSPDQKYVLAGCLDGTVKLWEKVTGEEIHSISGHSGLVIAIAAIYRPAVARLKRDLCLLAAAGADHGIHLPRRITAAGAVAFRFPCLAAGRAALGIVGKTLGLEELLFLRTEVEGGPAIGALD